MDADRIADLDNGPRPRRGHSHHLDAVDVDKIVDGPAEIADESDAPPGKTACGRKNLHVLGTDRDRRLGRILRQAEDGGKAKQTHIVAVAENFNQIGGADETGDETVAGFR